MKKLTGVVIAACVAFGLPTLISAQAETSKKPEVQLCDFRYVDAGVTEFTCHGQQNFAASLADYRRRNFELTPTAMVAIPAPPDGWIYTVSFTDRLAPH